MMSSKQVWMFNILMILILATVVGGTLLITYNITNINYGAEGYLLYNKDINNNCLDLNTDYVFVRNITTNHKISRHEPIFDDRFCDKNFKELKIVFGE